MKRYVVRCVGLAEAGKASQKYWLGQPLLAGSVLESAKMMSPNVLRSGA